jgi:hypothetical protein
VNPNPSEFRVHAAFYLYLPYAKSVNEQSKAQTLERARTVIPNPSEFRVHAAFFLYLLIQTAQKPNAGQNVHRKPGRVRGDTLYLVGRCCRAATFDAQFFVCAA